MAAYFIVDVTVEDPVTYDEYRKLAGPTWDLYGVKILARGAMETIEGDWQPQRLVILAFENTEHFRRWYDSPEYRAAREFRFRASHARAVLLQGV